MGRDDNNPKKTHKEAGAEDRQMVAAYKLSKQQDGSGGQDSQKPSTSRLCDSNPAAAEKHNSALILRVEVRIQKVFENIFCKDCFQAKAVKYS